MTWHEAAACRDLPASYFTTKYTSDERAAVTAQILCRRICPVRLQCAQTALAKAESGQEYSNAYIAGVWHVPASEATDTTRWKTMRVLLGIISAYQAKEVP